MYIRCHFGFVASSCRCDSRERDPPASPRGPSPESSSYYYYHYHYYCLAVVINLIVDSSNNNSNNHSYGDLAAISLATVSSKPLSF